MQNVRACDLATAHELVVKQIIKRGELLVTEDGEVTLESVEPMSIFVQTTEYGKPLSDCSPQREKVVEQYIKDLLEGRKDLSFSYNYHDRIFDYPKVLSNGSIRGNGDGRGKNQFFSIEDHFYKNRNTRRAQAITWVPHLDSDSAEPPCLQRIQFLIRNNKLNMHVDFRSNDMCSALGANMYALTQLQRKMLRHLHNYDALMDVELGYYSQVSVSAHVYLNRDLPELTKFAAKTNCLDILEHRIDECAKLLGKQHYKKLTK